jgi:hypothetical protein
MATFMEDRDIIDKLVHIPVRKVGNNSGGSTGTSKIKTENTQSTEDTMKTIQSKYEGGNDDTMKTIQSNFQNTSKGDTLAYSGTLSFTTTVDTSNMTNTEIRRLKKIQESDREAEKIK